jgi:predicted nucleic acid-binding protein
VILLDTSLLVDALAGERRSSLALRRAFEQGEEILLPALVVYEWLRGPRIVEELDAVDRLFPMRSTVVFGAEEAALSAKLYRSVSRPRNREIDLTIAACAILKTAALWTLNPADFRDIPGLRLYSPQ